MPTRAYNTAKIPSWDHSPKITSVSSAKAPTSVANSHVTISLLSTITGSTPTILMGSATIVCQTTGMAPSAWATPVWCMKPTNSRRRKSRKASPTGSASMREVGSPSRWCKWPSSLRIPRAFCARLIPRPGDQNPYVASPVSCRSEVPCRPCHDRFSSTRLGIMHLRFVPTESTFDYFEATRAYLQRHGKPVAFYSDKHGVFQVNRKDAAGGDGMTQFGRALDQLNIDIICANAPQAKGRVERANST